MLFRIPLALALTTIVCGLPVAASDSSSDQRQSVEEDLTPAVGPAIRGQLLMQRSVRDRYDREVGTVVNLIVDPYYGQVASLVVRPQPPIDRDRRLVLPWELVAPVKSKYLRAQVTASDIEASSLSLTKQGSKPYTRTLSLAAFRHYSLKPYWATDHDGKGTEGQDQFVMLSDLQNKVVKSPSDQRLGRISDIMIARADGKIVYTLFEHQHTDAGQTITKQFPIPMAAFVVNPEAKDWYLELPESILDGTQIVEGADYPQEISRAWVEYLHVRYGGGVFGGVQRNFKTR